MVRSTHAVTWMLVALAAGACGESNAAEEEGIPVESAASGGAAAAAPAPGLAAGTTVVLSIKEGFSTKDQIVGLPFTATVTENVSGTGGKVIIPAGAIVNGRVAEAGQSSDANQNGFITLKAESVVIDGKTYPINATVVEAAIESDAADSKKETAAKVGAGAVAGAIVGQAIGGNTKSTAIGAAVGAAAGVGAAKATNSGNASIKPGARVVIRLDQKLVAQ